MDSQPSAPLEPALSVYLPFRFNSREYVSLRADTNTTPISGSLLIPSRSEKYDWQVEPSKILAELRAIHLNVKSHLAQECLEGLADSGDTERKLSQLADESILASLKLALLTQPSRRQQIEIDAEDLFLFSAGRLGASRLDFNSPLELTFVSPLAPRSPLTGRGSSKFEELDRIVGRALEILSSANGFGYPVEIYLAEGGWSTYVSSDAKGLTNGSVLHSATQLHRFGGIFNPREWTREMESVRRADDRRRIISLRSLIGDSAPTDDLLISAATLSYKQYLSVADMEEFGALVRSCARCTDEALAADESTKNLTKISSPDSSESRHSDTLLNAKRELECVLRLLQIRFGGQHKELRNPNFRTVVATLHLRNVITDADAHELVQALELFDALALRADANSWLNCHAMRGESEIGHEFSSVMEKLNASNSPDFSLQAKLKSLITSWRRIVSTTCGIDTLQSSDSEQAAIADAILAPQVESNRISNYLTEMGFEKTSILSNQIKELEREEVSILSDAKCRFYFSKIATSLLERIATTPNPNLTLEQLIATTRSLGGKGILWQLFDANDACLDLYVRLCGSSPYLTSILAGNPGMIDELLDSLMLARLPSAQQMESVWNELNRGTLASSSQGIEPLLGSFKNAMHLNVGVHEILGHSTIADTHQALTSISDLCVQQIVDTTYQDLIRKHGVPHVSDSSMCPFSIFTFGKYGGVEPNYHSDMTLLCLYQSEGRTRAQLEATLRGSSEDQANNSLDIQALNYGTSLNTKVDVISNSEFYQLLAQRVGQRLNRLSRTGKLFDVKFWNLPNSPHAPLAWSVDLLRDYFLKNPMTSVQKLEFSKARVVYGAPTFASYSYSILQALLSQYQWTSGDVTNLLDSRKRQQSLVSQNNIKRGCGGTIEIELLAQSLTLAYSLGVNAWEPPSTFNLLSRLSQNQILQPEHATALRNNYDFLRSVESGLRLMNTSARHDLPSNDSDLERLTYVLRMNSRTELLSRVSSSREENHALLEAYIRQVPISKS